MTECRKLKNAVKAVVNILSVNVTAVLLLTALIGVFLPERRQAAETYTLGYLTSALVTLLTLYFSLRS